MKFKDTDYLYATMRIRANENSLLSARDIERITDAKTPEEAGKLLAESGYDEISGKSFSEVERALLRRRDETMALVGEICENTSITEVFALKYDFHNIKTIIKAELAGVDAERIMSDSGTVSKDVLLLAARTDDLSALPERMAKVFDEARETIAHTGDPQLSDFILDKAYFEMMSYAAKKAQSAFLEGYVRLLADVANLRSAVRALRQGKGAELLREAIVPGGNVPESVLLKFDLENGFSGTALSEAAKAGALAAEGGTSLLAFERELDNALIKYMQSAKYVAFDERPIIAYIAAREAEAMTVRIIMAGKLEGLSADEIRSRLRLSYV